jgi:hypothetical protein
MELPRLAVMVATVCLAASPVPQSLGLVAAAVCTVMVQTRALVALAVVGQER